MLRRCFLFRWISFRDMAKGKLGIFDSGLGGVLIAKALDKRFPDLDKIYLGDTLNLPYGGRSEGAIYNAAQRSVDALFSLGCELIVMACNTASARVLRRLQKEYLPENYPDRRILGVVVPTIEEAIDRGYKRLAVIGTNYTIGTAIYTDELRKINPEIEIVERGTPLLVPMIEHSGDVWIDDVLDEYLSFTHGVHFDALLLGCTHYIHLKDRIRARYDFDVIAQDEIIPSKLALYFDHHLEIYSSIGRGGNFDFYVTDLTDNYASNASALFGRNINVEHLEGVHDA